MGFTADTCERRNLPPRGRRFDHDGRQMTDGQRMIEERNGAEHVLRQYVWGLGYVDELVQVALNQDPANAEYAAEGGQTENLCERFFWACHDANFNVLGLVSSAGRLVERYEYTPYGQRSVYTHGWMLGDLDDDGVVGDDDVLAMNAVCNQVPGTPAWLIRKADLNGDGLVDSTEWTFLDLYYWGWFGRIPFDDGLVTHPTLESYREPLAALWGATDICPIGHQGLYQDKETDTTHNRARTLRPRDGRFGQTDPGTGRRMGVGVGGPAAGGGFVPRDPTGPYADGMSLYQYVLSNPMLYVDPLGLAGREAEMTSKYIVYLEWWAEQGVGEIKVMLARTREELMRYRYDRAADKITPVLMHGGRQLPGIANSAMKKIGPQLLKHMKHVVEMAGGQFTPQVARTAAGASGASGGGLGRAISRFFGSALAVLAVLDMTASTASAAEIPRPDLYTEISLESIGVTEQDFVELETPGKVGTEATGNKVETTAEIRQCPTGFKAYTFASGDTCWCMWQKRTNKAIAWKRAHEECANTANSGNADRIQAGETICVPE